MPPLPAAAAASLHSSCLPGCLLNPFPLHLLCHLTSIPPRCPLLPTFPASPPAHPQLLLIPGSPEEAPERGARALAFPPAGSSPCPFSPGEWQPPALSRQLLPVTARAAELHTQAFVTRHLDRCHLGDPESCSQPRPAPLGRCCILPDPVVQG